jgi:hypothetical protein
MLLIIPSLYKLLGTITFGIARLTVLAIPGLMISSVSKAAIEPRAYSNIPTGLSLITAT